VADEPLLMTAEEFLWSDTSKFAELIDGVVVQHEPPFVLHSLVHSTLIWLIGSHVTTIIATERLQGAGTCCGETRIQYGRAMCPYLPPRHFTLVPTETCTPR